MKTFFRSLPFWLDPSWLCGLAATLPLLLSACSQTPVTVDLHSLQSSGNVSIVCRGDDGDPAGHRLDECPDYEHATRRQIALVTQTSG